MKEQQSFDIDFNSVSFQIEKPVLNNISTLYNKHDDEPDFDCEFLKDDAMDTRGNEDILDPDPDEYADDYNDREWDTDIYDPYMEQTYY